MRKAAAGAPWSDFRFHHQRIDPSAISSAVNPWIRTTEIPSTSSSGNLMEMMATFTQKNEAREEEEEEREEEEKKKGESWILPT